MILWTVLWAALLLLAAHCSEGATVTLFADEPRLAGNASLLEVRSTLNRDVKFGRWTSSRIPYRLDQNYSK